MTLEQLDSPFAHLLGTNYIPTNSETRQILNFLSQPLSELSRLETEIDRHQAIIDDLNEQRDKAKKIVDAHRALLSPARRLPPEIVQEIFVRCLPTTHNPAKSTTVAPLLLGRICSAWRNISLSTPRLWSSIHLVVPTHNDISKIIAIIQLRCEALKEWLGRSGTLPLSISLTITDNPHPRDVSTASMIESLIQFSHRWNIIDLRVPYGLLEPLNDLTKDDVPCLEAIKIDDIFNWDGSELPQWHFSIIGTAPRLHRVSFVHFQGVPHNLPLPWARLTELSLETNQTASSLNHNEALVTLKQCPNLQRCTLCIYPSLPGGFIPPSEPIKLPALHTFRIHAYQENSDDLTVVFDHLFTPSLVKLAVIASISDDFISSPAQHVPFRSLLTRSSCPLESLTLSQNPISPKALIECLYLVPALTTLFVTDCKVTWPPDDEDPETLPPILSDELLRLLTPTNPESSDCLVPNLKSVNLAQCTAISDEVLMEFIQSRWRRSLAVNMEAGVSSQGSRCPSGIEASRLTSIKVGFERVMVVDILPRVQALSKEGLDIIVNYLLPHPVDKDYSDSPWEGLPACTATKNW